MTDSTPSDVRNRRTNPLLRMLIDEMLEQVRELHRHSGPWPNDERVRAEAALERIMSQVRTEALRRRDP
jgi:hypothetical protein